MKPKYINLYFDIAERIAELSTATRLKVGAVIVKDHRILSYGYNGTPPGFDNDCEYLSDGRTVTKPEVIHAEMNSIYKTAKCGESLYGSSIFITHSPCLECAKAIASTGIQKVYYRQKYRADDGIIFLDKVQIPHQLV